MLHCIVALLADHCGSIVPFWRIVADSCYSVVAFVFAVILHVI